MNAPNEKRLRELALKAAHTGITQFSRFLDPAEANDATLAARDAHAQIAFFGGYEGAERTVAAFYADDPPEEWPVAALSIQWNAKFASVAHRDLLGAVMALGLERETTGDIVFSVHEGEAYLFAERSIAPYIIESLTDAGRASIRLTEAQTVAPKPPEGNVTRVTVQTMRLDAVLSAGWKISRNDAQKLIRQELVKRNHLPELHADCRIVEGDLLSARGYGRMLVKQIQGETKKGRIGVMLFLYGK